VLACEAPRPWLWLMREAAGVVMQVLGAMAVF